jgi:hypothetical protein
MALLGGVVFVGCASEALPDEGVDDVAAVEAVAAPDGDGAAAPEVGAVAAVASAPGSFGAQYVGCDEFAGVGLAPLANVEGLVPDDYTVIEAVPGSATVVAQSASCEKICVGGKFCRPATFAQFGVGIAPPGGATGTNFYQIVFVTDHPVLALSLRLLGVNAAFTPKLEYAIGPGPELSVSVPRPKPLAFELNGPITLPDPNAPPNPVTTFNYWYSTPHFGNVVQQNDVTGIRFGEGSGVVLTATGSELQEIIGGTTLSFPFFAAPEIFDRADVSVKTHAF